MMTWYDDAMRTIIDLPDEQIAKLADLCAREGISRAEAIRRAVARYVCDDDTARRKQAFREAFGSWKHDMRDALEIVEELRSEWDR
jgi:metal-responsive CopG/Arc/MetJ family transcriptional regulator